MTAPEIMLDPPDGEELLVDLDGFEGPISLLLALAREQKVDLKQISILALANQYLAFVEAADRLRLELAADYLVMAAWLAYLKSRLLLPDPPPDDEPSGEELAAALQFRLQRLAAMQKVGAGLFQRPLLGRDVFGHGAPEGLKAAARPVYTVSLHDLLKAYAANCARETATVLQIRPPEYYTVEDALHRLGSLIGTVVEWRRLQTFLPPPLRDRMMGRSALAATFAASLELAKSGRIELKQEEAFGPIFLRAARPQA
jgi:segregation and condensation protein A